MRAKLAVALVMLTLGVVALGARASQTAALTNCDTSGAGYDAEEQAFLGLINAYRGENGLGPLAASDSLNRASQWKSENMGANAYFAHDDLNRSWVQRIRDCGYGYNTWLGENIAAGMSSAADAFNAWKNSPGHNANMLSTNYNAIGIGRAYVSGSPYGWYWSTDFGGTVEPAAATPTRTNTPAPPTPTLTPVPPPASYPCSDFSHDGRVRIDDVMFVVTRFGSGDPAADINNSGQVTTADVMIVVHQYNDVCV